MLARMHITSKLPGVGTTIFTIMSQLAARHGALNLGQGFPDFEGPPELFEAIARHLAGGRNQYAPMAGVPALREQIALKTRALYGREVDPETEVTVTSGATEGVLAALLLNRVVLAPGECLYQPAGSPHSYLAGAGVELMANSDNVLRCGLTPKYVDVPAPGGIEG